MIAITSVETFGGLLGLLLIVAMLVTLARIIFKREARWRRVRFGIFAEREPFDEPDLERGWDEADTEEIPPLRHRLTLPEEDK